MNKFMCRTIAALGLTVVSTAITAEAQQVASAHVEVLARSTTSWNGKPYAAFPSGQPQLTVLKFRIPAHTALPWHTHPYPNAGYVISGQLTIEDKATGKKQTFTAGQAFTESVNDAHRGVSGNVPTVMVIVYSGTPGVPTFTPLPGQKPEW
ncbi:cupin domain-containing protein [Frateuria aurantia]